MTTFHVDGHVHFHSVYSPDRFFDRALAVARASESPVCLWFVENWGDHAFRAFRDGAIPSRHRVERTGEAESLVVRDGGASVVLVCGRQIITTENLEVLVVHK
jgi:hypothetical protein